LPSERINIPHPLLQKLQIVGVFLITWIT